MQLDRVNTQSNLARNIAAHSVHMLRSNQTDCCITTYDHVHAVIEAVTHVFKTETGYLASAINQKHSIKCFHLIHYQLTPPHIKHAQPVRHYC